MTTSPDVIKEASPAPDAEHSGAPTPVATLGGDRKRSVEQIALLLFITVPFVALVAAIPLAWRWGGMSWLDLGLMVAMYFIGCHGITIGFHRYFTHGAFKAKRPLRLALAVAGSLALQGPVIRWVADHRRHHAFSDKDGDPHSPWGYGSGTGALIKGMWHAHM